MPNTPPSARRVVHQNGESPVKRQDSLFIEKKFSQETMKKTQYTKSFLEDYYKHLSIPSAPVGSKSSEEKTEDAATVERKEKEKEKEREKKHKHMTFKKKFIRTFKGSSKSDEFEITEPTAFSHKSHVGISDGGLQTQNLPEELQLLVEKLNESLGRLGARSVSEEELKLLLAQPEFFDQAKGAKSSERTKTETVKPKRKLSATIAQKMGLQSSVNSANVQIGEPVNFVKVTGFNFGSGDAPSSLKLKLELADRALQHESELRSVAEQRVADMSFSLSKLQIEMERLTTLSNEAQDEQKRLSELAKANKYQEVEISMWKKRLSVLTHRGEESLAAEIQKRREIEAKYSELLSQKSNNNNNNNNNNNRLSADVVRVEKELAEQRSESERVKAQFEQERGSLRDENESLRRELEEVRARLEGQSTEKDTQKKELMSRLEAVRIDCLKKVDEAVRRLEVERQQRRIDQMMIETLSKTNAEYQTQLHSAPQTPVHTAEVAIETKPKVAPPLPPPLPPRNLTKNSSNTTIRDEISQIKLQPVKADDLNKRNTPPNGLDAFVHAIIARRQRMGEDEDESARAEDGANNFDD